MSLSASTHAATLVPVMTKFPLSMSSPLCFCSSWQACSRPLGRLQLRLSPAGLGEPAAACRQHEQQGVPGTAQCVHAVSLLFVMCLVMQFDWVYVTGDPTLFIPFLFSPLLCPALCSRSHHKAAEDLPSWQDSVSSSGQPRGCSSEQVLFLHATVHFS